MAGAPGRTTTPKSFEQLWAELDQVPEGTIGEIVNGEIVEAQRPDAPHIGASTHLTILLGGPFRLGQGGPGGWVILAEPRIRFSSLMRVPDLAGWRAERF